MILSHFSPGGEYMTISEMREQTIKTWCDLTGHNPNTHTEPKNEEE